MEHFWATVTSNGYATGPLSCLYLCMHVMLVYCGQTVEWIKIPLTKEVGLDLGDIALDEDPASPSRPRKGAQHPHFSANVMPNGRPS